ncbi:MAG: lipid II flippase MurJ, partial [Flavobacteriales bacterium]
MNIILKLFSLKFISAILGVISSVITVRLFGASRTIEIFFAAQSLVYLVTSLTQSGQLSEIFLPEYHKLKSRSQDLGFMGLNVVINRFFVWGVVVIGVVFICAPMLIQIIVPGFNDLEQQQSVLIFRVLLPYLLLQLFNSFFITVLNAEKKFGRAELLSISNIVVNIIILLTLYKHIGIWALVSAVLVGKSVEFVFYLSQLYKIGFKYKFAFSLLGFDHSDFFKTMRSTIFYVGATQVYSIVLTAGISFLPVGTFAIFKYVQGLSGKIKGLVIQPFMTIFFTTYSSLLHSSRNVKNEFNKYFTSILGVNTVTIIGGVLLGDVFIDLLWGGKKFTHENVQL